MHYHNDYASEGNQLTCAVNMFYSYIACNIISYHTRVALKESRIIDNI